MESIKMTPAWAWSRAQQLYLDRKIKETQSVAQKYTKGEKLTTLKAVVRAFKAGSILMVSGADHEDVFYRLKDGYFDFSSNGTFMDFRGMEVHNNATLDSLDYPIYVAVPAKQTVEVDLTELSALKQRITDLERGAK